MNLVSPVKSRTKKFSIINIPNMSERNKNRKASYDLFANSVSNKLFSIKNWTQSITKLRSKDNQEQEINRDGKELNNKELKSIFVSRSTISHNFGNESRSTNFRSTSNFQLSMPEEFLNEMKGKESATSELLKNQSSSIRDNKIDNALTFREERSNSVINYLQQNLNRKMTKILTVKKKIEQENKQHLEITKDIQDKRKLRIKVHNILKQDNYFRCNHYESKNDSFNRKVFHFLESDNLKKNLKNYHQKFCFDKNTPGAAHDPKCMVVDFEVAHLNKVTPQSFLEERLTKEEINRIGYEPNYFVKNMNYTQHVKFFNQTSLIEKMKKEEDNDKMKIIKGLSNSKSARDLISFSISMNTTTNPADQLERQNKRKKSFKLKDKIEVLNNEVQDFLSQRIVKNNNLERDIKLNKEQIRNNLVTLVDRKRPDFYQEQRKQNRIIGKIDFSKKLSQSELRESMILKSIKKNKSNKEIIEKNKKAKQENENEVKMFKEYLVKIKENLVDINVKMQKEKEKKVAYNNNINVNVNNIVNSEETLEKTIDKTTKTENNLNNISDDTENNID